MPIEDFLPKPEEGNEKYQPKFDSEDLNDFSIKFKDTVDRENESEEKARHRKWAKNRAFYRGKQRGFWDNNAQRWYSVDADTKRPSEASLLVVNNQFRPQVKTLAKEFSRSKLRLRSVAISDSQSANHTSRFSDHLISYYQRTLLRETSKQKEARFLFLCGNSFRYTYFDKNKKGVQIPFPITGDKTMDAFTRGHCLQCGEEAVAAATECPQCGGAIKVDHVPEKILKNVVIGHKMGNSGEITSEVVDPVEIKVWAQANDLESTPYLRRRRFVKKEFLVAAFPFYKPDDGGNVTDKGSAQMQIKNTDTVGSKEDEKDLYEFTEFWIDKSVYARLRTKKETVLMGGGKPIPEGTLYSELFPDGMYVAMSGKDVLAYHNENMLWGWNHRAFDISVDGFWADGLDDSVMNQQIINEYTSLSVENVLHNASPKLVINPKMINPLTVTGRPKDMIPLSDNARQDIEPRKAIHQIQGMQLTNEVMEGIESSKRDMREQTGALLAFNGQGDPNITTATGMSLARDSALSLIATPLAISAEAEESWAWQVLRLVKVYWSDHKYKFLLGKYNEQESESFRDSELDHEIRIEIEHNSWIPETRAEKIQNLLAYTTAYGLPFGFLNPQVPQVIRERASKLYRQPADLSEISPDIRIAEKRLDRALETAESQLILMSEAGTEEEVTLLLQSLSKVIQDEMTIEEDIDEHQIFVDVYIRWLKTDEGQNVHPVVRDAIKQVIADHRGFIKLQIEDQQAMLPPDEKRVSVDQTQQFKQTDPPEGGVDLPSQVSPNQNFV